MTLICVNIEIIEMLQEKLNKNKESEGWIIC
jgi:hypothetical protein